MANPDLCSTRIEDGIALITIGSAQRIYFDPEVGDALHSALQAVAADDAVRVVVVTGGAPGYFVRHYSVASLVALGERLKGQDWPENTPYQAGSFDKAMQVAERMDKPV